MPETYVISDHHFAHANIIRYCNRPFSSEDEMNVVMEERWNAKVRDDDVVMYLGDLTAGLRGRTEFLSGLIGRLRGRKVLVRGNHDHQPDSFYLESGFVSVVRHLFLSDVLFVHVYGTKSDDKRLHLARETAILQERLSPTLTFHGHDHRSDIPEYPGHFNCAADRHSFTPVNVREALFRVDMMRLADDLCDAVRRYVDSL